MSARGPIVPRALVVRRASCGFQRQASAACHAAKARHTLAISGVEAQHSSFLSARAVVRWLRSDRVYARALHRREACFPRRALVVRRASCKLQCQASAACRAAQARLRVCARCLLGGGAALELATARAPCRTDCGLSMPPTKSTASVRGLSCSARDRGTTCKLRTPSQSKHACHAANARRRSLSLKMRCSIRACYCAHAVPRWLWSVHTSCKGTAPARGMFLSAHARGAMCNLRSLTSSQCRESSCAAQARLRSLSLGRRDSAQASCARAPCCAG